MIKSLRSFFDQPKLYYINYVYIFFIATAFFYLLFFCYFSFLNLTLLILLIMLILCIAYALYLRKYYSLSKIILLLTTIISVFLFNSFFSSNSGIFLYNFVILLAIYLLFDSSQKKIVISLYLITCISFITSASDLTFIQPLHRTPQFLKSLRLSMVLITFFITSILILIMNLKNFYKQKNADKNERIKTLQDNQEIKLSLREQEILQHLIDGKSNQNIVDIEFISLSTVKTHVSRILHKHNCNNRAALIAKYIK